jgi:hypothetical protein
MKPDRRQREHPLAYVIAQQYSSVTFFSLRALQNHCIAFCIFFKSCNPERAFLDIAQVKECLYSQKSLSHYHFVYHESSII